MNTELEALKAELAQLRAKVIEMEEWQDEYDKSYHLEYTAKLRASARLRAAEEVIFELAEQLGIEKNRVIEHITKLGQRHLDAYMLMTQNLGDSFAADVDDRELDEVPTDEAIPPLFPPRAD